MDIVDPNTVQIATDDSSQAPVYEDYYLAVMVGAIKEKDIPKDAKIKHQATYDNYLESKKPKKTKSKPSKIVSHKEKMAISDKPFTGEIVV